MEGAVASQGSLGNDTSILRGLRNFNAYQPHQLGLAISLRSIASQFCVTLEIPEIA